MAKLFRVLMLITAMVFATLIFAGATDALSAGAKEGDDSGAIISPTANIEEMILLQENGVIKGDPNGDLRPDDELTRAEFAAILCRAIGIEALAQSATMMEKSYFSDVSAAHWAAGYINTAAEHKAINGFEDGTFRPELSVTNEQVVKMLVAAWGYGEEAEELGGYPNGYMEIAKRFGVTDAVLFNYGIASKRWVACSFTYGALAMPAAENHSVDTPVKIELATGRKPRPENTGYIVDTAAILKKVTPQSAKYERTVIEQRVPDEFMPIRFHENSMIFSGGNIAGRIQFVFHAPGVKQAAESGYLHGDGIIDLSALPHGQYSFSLDITEGAVRDSYMGAVEKKQGGTLDFSGPVTRYTTLNVQSKMTIISHEVILSGAHNHEHNPFVLEAALNPESKPMLRVSYPFIVADNQNVIIGANTMTGALYDLPVYIEGSKGLEAYSYAEPFMGKNSVMDPFLIDGFMLNEPYWLQIQVSYVFGDDVVLVGELTLIENGGVLDFLLEGNIRYLTIDGYEILDYNE